MNKSHKSSESSTRLQISIIDTGFGGTTLSHALLINEIQTKNYKIKCCPTRLTGRPARYLLFISQLRLIATSLRRKFRNLKITSETAPPSTARIFRE